jgi:hypothetical protein
VLFEGNAPAVKNYPFGYEVWGPTLYCRAAATGFSFPTWVLRPVVRLGNPGIWIQPGPVTVLKGTGGTLQVSAVGGGPLSYQWFEGMPGDTGADFFVGLNQGLKTAGIDAGYGDAAANSQAYGATMASNVGKLIKQYGAGTGLSDADREFATKAAAGSVNMDEKAIRRVLDINDRAARNIITGHNKKVEGIKTNIPLKIEIPGGVAPMYATNGKERIVSNDGGATWQPVGAK